MPRRVSRRRAAARHRKANRSSSACCCSRRRTSLPSEPLRDDRPYANLLYVASSKLALDEPRGTAFQSSLAIGFLGLPFAEQLHRGVHAIAGSAEPSGYDHQISAGGEPTFMYAASRYRLLASGDFRGRRPYSVRFGVGGSVGYITEGNVEIAVRTDGPWWASSPASGDYAGHPQIGGPAPANRGRLRVQLEAGAKVRARVYNAFLEGQFRHSDVTFGSSELEPLLVDVWFGATTVLRERLERELQRAPPNRRDRETPRRPRLRVGEHRLRPAVLRAFLKYYRRHGGTRTLRLFAARCSTTNEKPGETSCSQIASRCSPR